MTLTNTTVRADYDGDGSQTVFPVNFVFWDKDDLRVVLRGTDGTETIWTRATQYSVTGGDGSEGSITVSTSPTDFTPQIGEKLTILSNVPNVQNTSLPLGGEFPSSTVERELDQTVRRIQQLGETIDRTVTLPLTSAGVSTQLPGAVANTLLGWNADGSALENKAPNDGTVLPALLGSLTTAEITQLLNIDTTTISAAQWGYLGAMTAQPLEVAAAPRGHIFGLELSNNATDASHDLDIAAGECASDASTPVMITLGAGITKRLDATFAEGTGNGGMASGNSLGPSRTLVIWAISKADGTADVIATDGSGDALSLTLPTGFVNKRVIMLLRTDGSSSVRGFSQRGDTILWDSTSADVEAVNPGTSAVLRSLSLPSLRPVEALGVVTLLQNDVDTTVAVLISSLDQTDQTPVVGGAHTLSLHSYAASRTTTGFRVRTNAIGQIRSRLSVSNANTTLYLTTEGYVYDRRSF